MNAVAGEPKPENGSKDSAVILIVEDELLVRMAVADQLRGAGYTVIEAVNASEALDVLRHGEHVTLIVSDIHMPGPIDGVELARRVRADYPHIKIVLASGRYTVTDAVLHDGFFRKPYDVEQMIRHVRALISKNNDPGL